MRSFVSAGGVEAGENRKAVSPGSGAGRSYQLPGNEAARIATRRRAVSKTTPRTALAQLVRRRHACQPPPRTITRSHRCPISLNVAISIASQFEALGAPKGWAAVAVAAMPTRGCGRSGVERPSSSGQGRVLFASTPETVSHGFGALRAGRQRLTDECDSSPSSCTGVRRIRR